MYIFYYDSGTTNTRAYLLKDGKLMDKRQIAVGSKNSAQAGGRLYLLTQLHNMYLELLAEHHLTDNGIATIYLSGMISSPDGIIEITHLSTPVDADRLKHNIVTYYEESVFRRDLLIIPGIKTIQPDETITLANIASANNMRGEEVELLGIMRTLDSQAPPLDAILLPGSHTQIAFTSQGQIIDILSTMTGELFHAILSETLIGSNLDINSDWSIDVSMVQMGYECLSTYGFNRAVYLVRTMALFLDSTPSQRISYLEGVLNGGVIKLINQKLTSGEQHPICLGITGAPLHYQIFDAIAQKFFPYCRIIPLSPADDLPYSVQGLLALLD